MSSEKKVQSTCDIQGNCEAACLNDCTDKHLYSYCPPTCTQCCAQMFCSTTSCSPCEPCEPSPDLCLPTPCDTVKDAPCSKRYHLLKHVVKCPPKSCCCPIPPRRLSFKPEIKCVPSGPMCYETVYMKSYNTPATCCLPTCW
jgi:hypothetical protein